MEQEMNNPRPNKPDYAYWLSYYGNLFWRWRLYIFFSFPTLVIIWLLLVLTFGKIRPELKASVLMGIENPSTVLVLPEATSNGLGKTQLIQSRNFLGEIVDSLSLHFVLPKLNRSSLLSYVNIDSTVIPGKYYFSIDEKSTSYNVTITNKKLGLRKKIFTDGELLSLDTLKIAGITLGFSPQFLKKPFSFNFYIYPRNEAVEKLKSSISIQGNTKRDPMQEGVVVVEISGTDPELISTTINLIADKFVEKNLSFQKRKTGEVMKALYEQLQVASTQLLQDENRVRAFKEENPKVGLGIDAQNAISNISSMESKNAIIAAEVEEANSIYQRISKMSGNEKDQLTSEALLFLSNHKIPGAIILQQDFNTLLQQKTTLTTNLYSPEHPLVKEIQQKLDMIRNKTVPILKEFLKKQQEELSQTSIQKMNSFDQLRNLPKKEMQLAALLRQQQINSEIYSNILSKYNQAKIADETEVPDIYILDYSVPPEEASIKKQLIKLLTLGCFVCILISFGPPVIVGWFDKRARSEEDIRRLMPFPFLVSIPVFKAKKIRKSKNSQTKYVDPKLLSFGPFSTYTHERLRLLRTKLNYRLETLGGKSFMITGYDSGEGKSLISSNIAIMIAQQYNPTLLIDADMHRGVLHNTFAVENKSGLSDLLFSNQQITEQIVCSSIQSTTFPNLFLLTRGSVIDNPTELLTKSRLGEIMKILNSKFSMIIFDTPPLSPVSDPIIISNSVSGTVLIVKAGKTNTAELNSIINEFPTLKEKILGVILNGINTNPNRKYKTYYFSKFDLKEIQNK